MDEALDYDVMSDQDWEPEAEDGEDLMVCLVQLHPRYRSQVGL